jgi:2-methylisocitrate lyase-like PEP mutase family enzyme
VGVNPVIYPVSLLRLAMWGRRSVVSIRSGVRVTDIPNAKSRARLYELLDYAYNAFDTNVFNFTLN